MYVNAGNFRISDGTDIRLNLDSSGNFGIGTSSPGTSSHVFGGQHLLTLGGATTDSFSVLEVSGKDGDDNAYVGAIEFINKTIAYAPGGQFLTGSTTGTQVLTVPMDAPVSIVYQCTSHAGMVGIITFVK